MTMLHEVVTYQLAMSTRSRRAVMVRNILVSSTHASNWVCVIWLNLQNTYS